MFQPLQLRRVASVAVAAALVFTTAALLPSGTAHAATDVGQSDFDGDGINDLAMAAQLNDRPGTAAIIVDYSSGLGDEILQSEARTHAGFGIDIATGDLNNDGYDDLVAGCSGCDWMLEGSTVTVFLGHKTGGLVLDRSMPLDDGNPAQAVAIGNLTQATTNDIASTQTGRTARVTTDVGEVWSDTEHVIDPPPSRDGHTPSVEIGDLNDDGEADIVVGNPTTSGGSVTIFNGPIGEGGQVTYESDDADIALGQFGASLAVTDFDGDGTDDLIVGAPTTNRYGDACGAIMTMPSAQAANIIGQETSGVPGICEAGDEWASSLVAADVNGDGTDEIVVGVPGEDIDSTVDAGSYTVLTCNEIGTDCAGSRGVSQQSAHVSGVPEESDRFAQSLSVTESDGAEGADLLVGAPGETVGTAANAGWVLVTANDSNGMPGPDTYNVNGTHYDVKRLGRSLG